jgi:hypothetical protein
MAHIQLGFCIPSELRDKRGRATFVADLNRALELATGHFDSAWIVDHLQFGYADVLEGFTALTYMAALFMFDCAVFPTLITLEMVINELLPVLND